MKVRIIDADALKNNMFHYAAPEMVWDKGDIEHKINEMPTIAAIPVEWLRGYTAVGVAPTGDRLTEGKERLIVHRILNEWQKEQEAR